MAIITLTTDFGLQDWFVGTMKGVVLGIAPSATLVDITHEIAPGDVQAGAFALAAAFRFFPPGTVHVAVVDPGVGSDRAAIVVETERYRFVGPDNGLLSLAVDQAGPRKSVYRLEDRRWFLSHVSQTFHGRDVFAPVAAHLSNGVPATELGPEPANFQRLAMPGPVQTPQGWTGSIVCIDRFGNAITNLPDHLPIFQQSLLVRVRAGQSADTVRLSSSYSAVPKGEPLAILGSSGFLEIAVNGESAAQVLGLAVGASVEVLVEDGFQG
ncbi:MAG: S-adenosyl-l-methionine hydroxide adenosyltransferase family protein [Verrucomicrobiia bacterium]